MVQKTLVVSLALFVSACGNGDQSESENQPPEDSSTFNATFDGKEYSIPVSCSYFDQDYFQFNSDKTDTVDSTGDGIIISGMQNAGKFVLTINDNGKNFSTPNLTDFTKGEGKASGSGELFEEGTANSAAVDFTVTCH